MGDKSGKKPKAKMQPRAKEARSIANPDDTNKLTPVWSIAAFDHTGPWGKDRVSEQEDHLWGEIFPKLRNYESMTWGQIYQDKHRNHSVSIADLEKGARERLAELNLDDLDSLFRFRLSGEHRVWGIRDGRVFRILWWDPHHEICPSMKKHT